MSGGVDTKLQHVHGTRNGESERDGRNETRDRYRVDLTNAAYQNPSYDPVGGNHFDWVHDSLVTYTEKITPNLMTSTRSSLQCLTKRSLLLFWSEITVGVPPVVCPIARGPASDARWLDILGILCATSLAQSRKSRRRIISDHASFAASGFISRATDVEIWRQNRSGEERMLGVMVDGQGHICNLS